MRIDDVRRYRVDLPLTRPYRLSYRTLARFEPRLVEIGDAHGRIGWGEQHIAPGSSQEARTGGWAFAATAVATAIEVLDGPPVLLRPLRVALSMH